MNNDQLDDLKQFISASISQSEGRLRHEFVTVIADLEGRLRQEMADGFLAVGEAIAEIHQQLETQQEQYKAVDKRLTRLERRMA